LPVHSISDAVTDPEQEAAGPERSGGSGSG